MIKYSQIPKCKNINNVYIQFSLKILLLIIFLKLKDAHFIIPNDFGILFPSTFGVTILFFFFFLIY